MYICILVHSYRYRICRRVAIIVKGDVYRYESHVSEEFLVVCECSYQILAICNFQRSMSPRLNFKSSAGWHMAPYPNYTSGLLLCWAHGNDKSVRYRLALFIYLKRMFIYLHIYINECICLYIKPLCSHIQCSPTLRLRKQEIHNTSRVEQTGFHGDIRGAKMRRCWISFHLAVWVIV